MRVNITNVNMRYNAEGLENVQVHFSGHDDVRTIKVSGYIPLTAEEYAGNEAVTALEVIVRERVSTKIMEPENAE
ncbi:hypothetical protein M3210_03070 [Oceanobacillus luteolus]|uniref:hypothetical protein n=1 Tax=Oceanobacillus luteolus TaxID=1274358 RepID=UPI00203EC061|nr:hypothetical protein [Oceanobacillus luteolus]MCM3739245.1 hypothetical protein [Oceanobacillus luteolus]